ncbi:small kinetochore-associated protein [Pundamilia nyererei]|uniref:Small kinetochore-associated protein n=1 Tax=Pundamilia nyererei TaxID=303518 RepID=A0A9Y3R8S8_9CICH|nr:PREDICTED: uncharacterized protein LOC102194345 [Pundamilia nyererei]
MSSKIPRGIHPSTETKKNSHKQESKDTATAPTTSTAAQRPDGVLKPHKENAPRKNVAPKVQKAVFTRYGQQAELKEQNQCLIAANEELAKNLTDTQQRVAKLELQYCDLQKENAEVQKNLKDCHALLITAKIDPVLGERVGDTARQSESQRKEVMSISADLLNEIKTFGDIASQQRARLEEIQETMRGLKEAREQMVQERENFSSEAAELERALKEAEALLL